MPLPNADQFVGQNVTEEGFKQAQTQLIEYLSVEVPNNEKLVNSFATRDLALASTANMPINYVVTVTADPDTTLNGEYIWDGVELKRNPYDPKKEAVNESIKTTQIALDANNGILQEVLKMGLYDGGEPKIIPLAVDNVYKILLGFNTETNRIVALGLDEKTNIQAFTDTASIKAFFNDSANIVPIAVDQNDNIILGFNKSTGKLVGLFDEAGESTYSYDINQIVFYGQSLSRGGANEPGWISTTQPYFNITFEGTSIPTGFGSFNPLVEGYNETPCSGCANGSVYLAYTENGINPADNVILASAAGVGGAHLRQLIKGTTAYTNMLQHVAAGHSLALAQGKTHGVTGIGWAQGEENLRLLLDLDIYSEMLPQTFRDMKADFRAITNQLGEIRVISYQLSTRIGLSEVVCKTQFDLAKRREIAISTPTYLFDYDDRDSVHFHPPSYKWMGAYYARAHKQWVVDGRFPDWLEPMGATILGKTITVSFDVPTAPLVFDTTLLAPTQDQGFAISDGTNLLAIQSITANDSTVTIELVDNPSTINGLSVRYGLDYLGIGKPIADGKSGNLRDSTPDTVLVQNIVKPLYHICPHFELEIINGAI